MDRKIVLNTGRSGAIMVTNSLRAAAGLPPLTKEEESKFEPGTYRLSARGGIEYLGLFDPDRKDGKYAVKQGSNYQVEVWSGGKRISYTPISEEEFNDFKKKAE